MILSVIIPARNEEDCLQACLGSLVSQSREGFRLGQDWELLVVDDGSRDRTRSIAEAIPNVTVVDPHPLQHGWTGKANAIWSAMPLTHGEWFLFTDADTIHEDGNLLRAINEAQSTNVGMLSYSPRQIVSGFWQRAFMSLLFGELVSAYPFSKLADPDSDMAAANGQFILVRRDEYYRMGGHAAVAGSLHEDVHLARIFKKNRIGVGFRHAPDAVSTRMYRTFGALWEGFTKNLALVFSNPLGLALRKMVEMVLFIGLPAVAIAFNRTPYAWILAMVLWILLLCRFYWRVSKSFFPPMDCSLAIFGLPILSVILVRSWFHHRVKKRVAWKERYYDA